MKDKMMDDYENVGIMQGFLDEVGEGEDEREEEENSDDAVSAKMLNRRVDSPEILMNNLRGDMRSVDARREELADLVGYEAASETPETVLAMLQPVLAQGGGIGALPQSGPMAQGPQPPMPPPPGGAMGAPPPGAPPLPPGGAAPPAGGDMAALLAAAGPPPGGGGAPGGPPMGGPPPGGPMIGPDGQPIPPEGLPPIQMRDGGLVQRFQDGSDEEGVTPYDERSTAAGMLYSPEMTQAAQMAAMSSLFQGPQEVPTLEKAMQARLPEYERLLGPDREATKANMLFDIAGAALNFASNRGPRGEVLRGSPMSRLAGAFSNLPAAIQKRVNDIETTQRQLKLLALQAGEKDRDEIQQINTKLASEKRSVLNTILQADAKFRAAERRGVGSPISRSDWEMSVFNTPGLAERYAAGQTTPQENNLLASAITSYTEPRYQPVLDPDSRLPTGQYQTLPGKKLPQFVLEAQNLRKSGAVTGAPVTLNREPTAERPTRDEMSSGELLEAPAPLLSPGGEQPTVAGTARASDRPEGEPAMLPREVAMAAPVSLWRDRSKIAGPFATVYAGVSQVPGLGDPMRDITLARSQAEFVAEEFKEAFLKSAQNSVTEQLMLDKVFKLRPAGLKDPETYGTELIALSTVLDQVLDDYRKKSDTRPGTLGSTLSPEQRTEAREKVSMLERARGNLGLPPAVYSEEEIAKLPPDVTEVLWMGRIPAKVRGR
jgi:hypothetical protein